MFQNAKVSGSIALLLRHFAGSKMLRWQVIPAVIPGEKQNLERAHGRW